MAFGKPASLLAAIIFTVGFVSGFITLIVSALHPYVLFLSSFSLLPLFLSLLLSGLSYAGYVLGILAGLFGLLVCSAMVFWLVLTQLNEFDPAWIIFLIVLCVSALFAFIAGILFAIPATALGVGGVAPAFNFIHFIICAVCIFFWIRSRGLVPETNVGQNSENSGEYQEW